MEISPATILKVNRSKNGTDFMGMVESRQLTSCDHVTTDRIQTVALTRGELAPTRPLLFHAGGSGRPIREELIQMRHHQSAGAGRPGFLTVCHDGAALYNPRAGIDRRPIACGRANLSDYNRLCDPRRLCHWHDYCLFLSRNFSGGVAHKQARCFVPIRGLVPHRCLRRDRAPREER